MKISSAAELLYKYITNRKNEASASVKYTVNRIYEYIMLVCI